MGVDTRPALARWLWPLAVANLLANITITVTGAAVRLTGSGLGCPTWPRCTDESYVPHGELGIHGAIEFGNRMITWILVVLAIALLYATWRLGRRHLTRLALLIALGVPLQAIVGGITVLTDLNPWVVGLHFIVSMAMIMVCLGVVDHLRSPSRPDSPPLHRALAWVVMVAGWVVLYLGTVVTGAGPHAGDIDAKRNGLDVAVISQVHASAVYVLVIATVALLIVAARSGNRWLTVVTAILLVLELGQGALGWTQYVLDLQELLVAMHVLGASLVAAGFARVWLATREHTAGDEPVGPLLAWASGQDTVSAQPSNGSSATATNNSER